MINLDASVFPAPDSPLYIVIVNLPSLILLSLSSLFFFPFSSLPVPLSLPLLSHSPPCSPSVPIEKLKHLIPNNNTLVLVIVLHRPISSLSQGKNMRGKLMGYFPAIHLHVFLSCYSQIPKRIDGDKDRANVSLRRKRG
jgi:hypothetical protein